MKSEEDLRILGLFSMPKPVKITGRSSSITNSFVNGIIPVVQPNASEIREVLEILGMTDLVSCAYCGDKNTEWDHLRPLVVDKRPTGFISEIDNLVPSCGKCNQSKGNKDWHIWILSDAKLSPKTRKVPDLEQRVQRLEAFESWGNPTKVDFTEAVSPELWKQHWDNHSALIEKMIEAERTAALIRNEITAYAQPTILASSCSI